MEVITSSVTLQGRAFTRKVQRDILFNASLQTKYDIFRQWTRDEFEGLPRTSRLQAGNAICGIWSETSLKNHPLPPRPRDQYAGVDGERASSGEVQQRDAREIRRV
jgi:hypothetical protein